MRAVPEFSSTGPLEHGSGTMEENGGTLVSEANFALYRSGTIHNNHSSFGRDEECELSEHSEAERSLFRKRESSRAPEMVLMSELLTD